MKKHETKRAWPLILGTWASHVLHISDENSPDHICGAVTRCGRDLRSTKAIGRTVSAADFDIDDDTRMTGWKRNFIYYDLKGKKPTLCARCGTVADFKEAQADYLKKFAEKEATVDRRDEHKSEILDRLYARRNEDVNRIAQSISNIDAELEVERVKFDDGYFDIVIKIEGRAYKITMDYEIHKERDAIFEAEKEVPND